MALTEAKIKAAIIKEKAYRVADENGLFLEVRPSGSRVWRHRYSFQNRPSIITYGEYPLITIKEARGKRDATRSLIAHGLDPSKANDSTASVAPKDNFGKIALAWLDLKKRGNNCEKNKQVTEWRVNKYVIPMLGDRDITDITSADLLEFGQNIQKMGYIETAHRVMSIVRKIFQYAIIKGYVTTDPTFILRGTLTPSNPQKFAHIDNKKKLGQYYASLDCYTGSAIIREALKFTVLTFPRPNEIRKMLWTDLDFDEALWRIPDKKMKMRRPHLVPLSRQALEIIEYIRPLTGHGQYVFPSPRNYTGTKPMSDAALVAGIRSLGYEQSEVTAHGFRHTASTMLNESQLWSPDAIEKQLAHSDEDKSRRTYNAAEYLDERRKMMQWWADSVESWKEDAGGNNPLYNKNKSV